MSFFIRSSDHDDEDEENRSDEEDEKFTEGTLYDPSQIPRRKILTAESSSVINFYPGWCRCFESASIRYPHGDDVTWKDLIRYVFQCPPHGALARIIVFLTIFGLSWAILYFLIGSVAGMKGPIFTLINLEISGLFLGMLVKVFGFPSLLAPLVIGMILRNFKMLDIFEYFKHPYTDLDECRHELNLNFTTNATANEELLLSCCRHAAAHAQSGWITPIREIALTMILTRAGLELSPKQLKKLKGVVPALAFLPCMCEALTASVLFYFIYFQLKPNYMMCLVAGFALAAVSPAVVARISQVPGMLSIAKKGYGLAKGIPTLLIASSSIDDVLAISFFTLFLSIGAPRSKEAMKGGGEHCGREFKQEHDIPLAWQYAGGVLGLVVGIVHGIIAGMILHFIPSRDMAAKGTLRLAVLLAINITSLLGYEKTEVLSSAGSICVLLTSFVASFGWRSQRGWKPVMHEVEHKLAHLWTLCVPILFGTIGKEMKFVPDSDDQYFNATERNCTVYKSLGHPFSPMNIVKLFGIIGCCLLIRSIVAYTVVGFAGLNVKERIFVALAWIPKATVQAALAPLVLTVVVEREITSLSTKWIAMNTVALAVFGILVTAPAGAILIAFCGPRLLTKADPAELEDEEFPNGIGQEEEEEPPPIMSRRESHRFSVGSLSGATTPRRSSVKTPKGKEESDDLVSPGGSNVENIVLTNPGPEQMEVPKVKGKDKENQKIKFEQSPKPK